MDTLEGKIQAVRHICKQLEKIDEALARSQDIPLAEEYLFERECKLEQLKKLLNR